MPLSQTGLPNNAMLARAYDFATALWHRELIGARPDAIETARILTDPPLLITKMEVVAAHMLVYGLPRAKNQAGQVTQFTASLLSSLGYREYGVSRIVEALDLRRGPGNGVVYYREITFNDLQELRVSSLALGIHQLEGLARRHRDTQPEDSPAATGPAEKELQDHLDMYRKYFLFLGTTGETKLETRYSAALDLVHKKIGHLRGGPDPFAVAAPSVTFAQAAEQLVLPMPSALPATQAPDRPAVLGPDGKVLWNAFTQKLYEQTPLTTDFIRKIQFGR